MDVEFARQQMIEQQIRAAEVLDPRVLQVMAEVPREQFVPDAYHGLAFADVNVPLPCGQVMMTPTVEGRMLQALPVPISSTLSPGWISRAVCAVSESCAVMFSNWRW